ncbi:MAG: hypothetical protein QM601_12595 [Pseudoxanthomonas sp.]
MNATTDIKALRVDHVGSLLRPPSLIQAFADFHDAKIDAQELRLLQDQAIRDVVAKQVAHGLPIVNDGEYRREVFGQSFSRVAGLEDWWSPKSIPVRHEHVHYERGGYNPPAKVQRRRPSERIRLVHNDIADEYAFVSALTDTPAKVTLIGIDRIIHGYGQPAAGDVYASLEQFVADLIEVQRQLIAGVVEAGGRYVSIDEPSLTGYVDPATIAELEARGEDPHEHLSRAIRADNEVIAGHPGVTFGVHLCRGNRQSLWHREGFYDDIAEQLFNELDFDRFLLEYDTPRAGSFAPLRFVPKGKIVVLGLITTKTGEIEQVDAVIRRIEEAARYVPIEQLALSPQCGFASVIQGNLLSEDAQWRKLDLVSEVARRVWGG